MQQLREQPAAYPKRLDSWSRRNLEELPRLHFDIRADNILLSPERVWFVDWPHACVGAPWVDIVAFAPSVAMQGGPSPEEVIGRHTGCRTADPDAITAVVAALAGFFSHRSLQRAHSGLPTVRAFQAGQGAVARQWVARRTGWS